MENESANHTYLGRSGLYSLSFQVKKSARIILKMIDSLDIIYGYDIPQLVIVLSRFKISGHLNIISDRKNIYGISFTQGEIYKIDYDDPSTFIGQICVQEGYLKSEEVEFYLNQTEFRFGEKLLNDKKLTVEQLSQVLSQQSILRLTKLINKEPIKVNFSASEFQISDTTISYNQILELSVDWVFTCFSDSWLQMHYMDLKHTEFQFKKEFLVIHNISIYLRMIEFVGFDFISQFEANNTIQKIQKSMDIKIVLRIVHQLILMDAIVFLEAATERIFEADVHSFSSAFLKANAQEKLYLLTAFTRESEEDTQRIFETFSKKMVNLKIDQNLKINLLKAVDKFIHNSKLIDQTQFNQPKNNVEVQNILISARNLIGQRLFYKASLELKKIDLQSAQNTKKDLYVLWCIVGYALDAGTELDDSETKNRIKKLKPDIKLDAEYFFVLGLYSFYKKEFKLSDEYFQKSYLLDPQLVILKPNNESMLSQLKSLLKLKKNNIN